MKDASTTYLPFPNEPRKPGFIKGDTIISVYTPLEVIDWSALEDTPNYNVFEVVKDQCLKECVDKVLFQVIGRQPTTADYKHCTTFTWEDKPDRFGLSYKDSSLGIFITTVNEERVIVNFEPCTPI